METKQWLGFGRQKQHAVALARNDWVLCLDVDERVSERLARAIREALASRRYQAYRMSRRNRFLGRWLAHGEGYPDWTLRLFHRAHAGWSNDEVHEAVLTTAEWDGSTAFFLTVPRGAAPPYREENTTPTPPPTPAFNRACARATGGSSRAPLARFVKFYFLRLGFLDGGPGFAHVVIGCNNTFHKYLKLIELQKSRPAAGDAR